MQIFTPVGKMLALKNGNKWDIYKDNKKIGVTFTTQKCPSKRFLVKHMSPVGNINNSL